MSYKYVKANVTLAKILRCEMTEEEKRLWYDFLRELPVTVHRQKNIGRYIVDFYIASAKIVIELDGFQHGDPENAKKDLERDAYLQKMGITVLRYTNKDIHYRFKVVCEDILQYLNMNQ